MSSSRRRRAIAWLLPGLLVATLLTVGEIQRAEAADAMQFDPGFIISDENFYNSRSMSKADISAFLAARGASCVSTSTATCIKDKVIASGARDANDYCAALEAKAQESAANAIYRVALACGINPQVILVTLQKEQGLITNPKSESAYQRAMGYGCPDTGGCDTKYYGFFNQIYNAAWQFQRYRATPTAWNYQAGRYNTILFHPDCSLSSQVYIRNQATAALYIYTPYQPDALALAAGYGSGGSCSSYGNRNFWLYFTDWFGAPGNLVINGGFESGSVGWGSGVKTVGISVKTDAGAAAQGSRYASTSTDRTGSSLRQAIAHPSSAGQVYSATIWVKSRTSGVPFEGKLRLTATGGANEYLTVPFTAVDTWQQVTVTLPVTRGHSGFWIDIYEFTKGISLAVDGVSLARGESEQVRQTFPVANAGFEASYDGWQATRTIDKVGIRTRLDAWPAAEGSSFLLAHASQAGATIKQALPAYLVVGRTYTASVKLRTSAVTPFEGALVLRGLGGASDAARTDFVVGSSWTYAQVSYTPSLSGLSALQFEVRLNTVGEHLHIDDVVITTNLPSDPSLEASALGPWNVGVGSVETARVTGGAVHPEIPDAASATAVTRTSASVASVQARLVRQLVVGDTYTASVMLRGSADQVVRGSLRVWGLGASSEYASTAFELDGDAPALVSTPFTVSKLGASELRVELYINTVGAPVIVDGLRVH